MQNYPGLSHQTGGRRITIRARMGLRSGKMGNRGTYGSRSGDGLKREKWVPGGGLRRERQEFFVPDFFGAGRENFRKNFLKVF